MYEFNLKKTDSLIHSIFKIYGNFFIKWLGSVCVVLITQFIFYIQNRPSFHLQSSDILPVILGNIRFATSIVSVFLIPYFLISTLPILRQIRMVQIISNSIYIIINFILILAGLIDVYYYQYAPKRSTLSIFEQFLASSPNSDFVTSLIKDYWLGLIIVLVLTYLSYFLCSRKFLSIKTFVPNKLKSILTESILFLLVLMCLIFCYRGFGRKPLNLVNTLDYSRAELSDLIVNTPFVMFKNINRKDLVQIIKFEDESQLNSIYTPLIKTASSPNNPDPVIKCLQNTKVQNIMVIMLESFSPEYIGFYNQDMKENITPFLDSIISKSVWFKGYATSSNTAQAFVSIHLGIPALLNDPYIFSKYSTNKVKGLPEILKNHGFSTNFFLSDNNGVLYFDSFSSSIGFDHYYGKKEYDQFAPGNNDYNGTWGVYDDKFFNLVDHVLQTSKKPFFTTLLTTATHHPFLLPEEYQSVFLQNEGEHPIIKTVRYTDTALENLFKKFSSYDWYNDTLFIFTADHNTYLSPQASSSTVSKFQIPIFFFKPGWSCTGGPDILLEQTDLYPIILDVLGIKEDIIVFGKGFDYSDRYVTVKDNGFYSLIKKDYLIRSNEDASSMFCEPIEGNSPSVCDNSQVDKRFFEAFLQQYTTRIILNKTHPSEE